MEAIFHDISLVQWDERRCEFELEFAIYASLISRNILEKISRQIAKLRKFKY